MLFIQTNTGKFISTNENLFAADSLSEDVNAVFFDADGDGNQDLYVVCGGNETETDKSNVDRLYINSGEGKFIKSNGLPVLYGNKSVAVVADVDHDGDMDMFVGGRVVAERYGVIPKSYLLLNDGKGKFSIASESMAPGLQQIAMITDAAWAEYDADYGTVILNEKNGFFKTPHSLQTGFIVDGEVRDMKIIRTTGGMKMIAVARNNNSIKMFSLLLRKRNDVIKNLLIK